MKSQFQFCALPAGRQAGVPNPAAISFRSPVCRAEGAALSDALIVLRGVTAHDLRLLQCDAEMLLHKIDRRENGQKRVPLAAARPADLTDLPERGRRHFVRQRKRLVGQRR